MEIKNQEMTSDMYLVVPIIQVDRAVTYERSLVDEKFDSDTQQIKRNYKDKEETKWVEKFYQKARNKIARRCYRTAWGSLFTYTDKLDELAGIEEELNLQIVDRSLVYCKIFLQVQNFRITSENNKPVETLLNDITKKAADYRRDILNSQRIYRKAVQEREPQTQIAILENIKELALRTQKQQLKNANEFGLVTHLRDNITLSMNLHADLMKEVRELRAELADEFIENIDNAVDAIDI